MAAHQEEGWPLGLQPLNVRIGLGRNRDYYGSMSFNTATAVLTPSPTSSTDSSSGLDTESTGSFFHDRSITLGSLIGVSSTLKFSRRSIQGRSEPLKVKKPCKTRPWVFSLCSRDSIEVKNTTHTTLSLGQFLAVERRASSNDQIRTNHYPRAFVPDEISLALPLSQSSNSLFVNGQVAPPQSSPWSGSEVENGQNRGLEQGNNNGYRVPVLFSCMCGHDSH